MLVRFAFYTFLLAGSCAARLQSDHWTTNSQAAARTLKDRTCWEDGTFCDTEDTCTKCCSGDSYILDDRSVCGTSTCLANGTVCQNETDYTCHQCCSGAYKDGGKKCGGECLESGTACDLDTTCGLCCNHTFWQNGDSYQCGCMEDGTSCIAGDSCFSCCNGAYADNGWTCGGTCIEDGTECSYGEDCHLCCGSYASYWYSTGKMHCGTEPCFADGESCIPGQNCDKCCSGGAYDGDGTVCGGKCLSDGAKCSSLGSCNKCCSLTEAPDVLVADDDFPASHPSIGNTSHWNASKESMVCGPELCWEDGTDCIPDTECFKCCNGAYADNGTKCGGKCLENGSKCNYFSTCNQCCIAFQYNSTMGSYVCTE